MSILEEVISKNGILSGEKSNCEQKYLLSIGGKCCCRIKCEYFCFVREQSMRNKYDKYPLEIFGSWKTQFQSNTLLLLRLLPPRSPCRPPRNPSPEQPNLP